MDEINSDFQQTDVAIVIGANDVVNPAGADGSEEPDRGHADPGRRQGAHGDRHQAQPSPGFAGIPNPLFAADNTLMYFADGKKAILDLANAIKQG